MYIVIEFKNDKVINQLYVRIRSSHEKLEMCKYENILAINGISKCCYSAGDLEIRISNGDLENSYKMPLDNILQFRVMGSDEIE